MRYGIARLLGYVFLFSLICLVARQMGAAEVAVYLYEHWDFPVWEMIWPAITFDVRELKEVLRQVERDGRAGAAFLTLLPIFIYYALSFFGFIALWAYIHGATEVPVTKNNNPDKTEDEDSDWVDDMLSPDVSGTYGPTASLITSTQETPAAESDSNEGDEDWTE